MSKVDDDFDDSDGESWKDGDEDSSVTPSEFRGQKNIDPKDMTPEQLEQYSQTVYESMKQDLEPVEITLDTRFDFLAGEMIPNEVWIVDKSNKDKLDKMFKFDGRRNRQDTSYIKFNGFSITIKLV